MDTKVNVNEISVERIIALEKQNTQLQQQVGELRTDKKNLEERIKEGQKEVKIVKGRKYDRWGDPCDFEIESVELRNLNDIEEIVRKEYQKDIEEKDNNIKLLKNKLDDKESEHDRKIKEVENEYEGYRLDTKLEFDRRNREIKEKLNKAERELEKVKQDKTDEQEKERRNEEIIKLKTYTIKLEKTIKGLTSTNIFKRIWNAILDTNARIEAQKELLKENEEIRKIKCEATDSWLNGMINRISNYCSYRNW